jgi:hypothetical protein
MHLDTLSEVYGPLAAEGAREPHSALTREGSVFIALASEGLAKGGQKP